MHGKLPYLAPIAVAIFVLISILIYTHFGYLFGHDTGVTVFNSYDEYAGLYVWSIYDYTGVPNTTTPIFDYLFGSIGYLTKVLTGNNAIGFIVFLYTQFLVGALGMFYLVYTFTKNFGIFKAQIIGIISSLMFVIPISAYGETSAGVMLPFFILTTYMLLKHIDKYKKIDLIFLALSIFTAGVILSMGGTYFGVQSLLFILTVFVFLTILAKSDVRLNYIKSFFYVVAGSVTLNLSWMLGPEISSKLYYAFLTKVSSLTFIKFYTIKSIGIIFSFDFFPTDKVLYFILFPSLLIFIIAILSLILKNKNYRLEYNYLISIFIGYLVITFFGNTIAKPFGNIFKYFYKYLPYLSVFRGSFISIHYIAIFTFSLLFGYGAVLLLKRLDSSKIFTMILILLLVSTVIIFLYESTYGLNAYLGYGSLYFHNIPKYVINISNYLNNNIGNFAVATLPSAPGWQTTSWYYGVNIYSSLVYTHEVFTGGETSVNELIFPPSTNEYYKYLGSTLNNFKITNESLSNLFGIFGIKYLILESDVLNNTKCNCGYYPFNLTVIAYNLNHSKDINLVYFDNSSVYENINYVPLVYSSNIDNIGNSTITNEFRVLGNYSFDIKNNSVFTNSIVSFYNDSNTINATQIANFSKPNISFVENTPTKVTVHVSNATTPYYLVFRETYDPHWTAFYSNGTEVNPRDHIAVNGFANAWYMNKTGNYTITLYYTLQTDAWIAWGVSFAALFVTIGIGIYGWKEQKRKILNKQ
jgi:hypothetical protein